MFKALCIAIVFLSLTASCTKKPEISLWDVTSPPVVAQKDVLSALHTDFTPERYMFVRELNTKGKVVFFYQDEEGYTHYYNGKEDIIINKDVMDKYKKRGAVPLSMSYGYDGRHIYFSQPVRWAQKKLIFIKLEPDGRVVYTKELSALEEVLKPASMAFDGRGNILLTWIDETPPYIKAAYTVVREDKFAEKEEVISFDDYAVLSARPFYDSQKGFALVYVRTDMKQNGEIKVRYLADGSEKELFSGHVYDFDMFEGRDAILIRPYQMAPDFKLLIFNKSFEKIKEYSINKPAEIGEAFSLFTNGSIINGEPFVFGVGASPMSVEVEGYYLPQKPNIYYSYAGRGFERLVGGLPFMFSSTDPSFDSSGKLTVAAYMDKRLGHNTVMLTVFDGDGRLLKRDMLLEKPFVETGTPRVANLGGDVYRIFYPVKDKDKSVWIYRAKDINAESVESLYSIPLAKDKLNLLMESASMFAECRKKNDYDCVYAMFDPTYRAGISKGIHEDMLRKTGVKVKDYKIEKCVILADSILAACDSYIQAELPKEIMGKPIKESERVVTQHIKGNLWLFKDGKWHFLVDVPMLGYVHQW